jgi:ribosome-binding protein aMBF1 (putative translation factor)
MLEPTKKRRSENMVEIRLTGPKTKLKALRETARSLDFLDTSELIPWREVFSEYTDEQLPGLALAGARHKEGLSQVQLAKLTGIPQRHISEMENGKRAIGKETAKRLAKALHVSYKVLL